jgi:cysteine-rich repeat protein
VRLWWAFLAVAGCIHGEASVSDDEGAGGAIAAGGQGGAPTKASVASSAASSGSGAGTPGCGDGALDPAAEECDDGNQLPQDGCDPDCRVECAAGWLEPATHHCYLLIGTPGDWFKARAGCQALAPGFDLAAISSQEEHDFLVPLLPAASTRMWIGASDQMTEGSFEWTNGEPWGFTMWEDMEPNDSMGMEDCVELRNVYLAYQWNDMNCASRTPGAFLCELTPAGTP